MTKYNTVCYYSEEDKLYIVFAPDLPGCFSDGETIEEAKKNGEQAIEEWIEYANELGREIPEPLSFIESSHASVLDIAEFILKITGPISTLMLQKLVYYCYAWSLAWFDCELFPEKFQAWRKGPVCKELYDQHKGKYVVGADIINSKHHLSLTEKRLIQNILYVYKDEDPEELSRKTHMEAPWTETRGNISENERCNRIIPPSSIKQYYKSLIA